MRKILTFLSIIFTLVFTFCLISCDSNESSQPEEEDIKYSIYVENNPNVEITVPNEAVVGSEIQITAVPKEGYYLETVKVNGENIASLTFIMPECDVLIDVSVVNGKESYLVSTVESVNGTIFTLSERARFGEEVKVRIFPNEGYRLQTIYSNGVAIPFKTDEYGNYINVIMPREGIVLEAEYKPLEKITTDYDFILTAETPTNPAVSYWNAKYTNTGIIFNVLVKDTTIVNTASLATYGNDNIEFQICKATNVSSMEKANAFRCLVNVGGRYLFQKANGVNETYDHSSAGVGLLYGDNFKVDSVMCKKDINGFDGYAIEVYIGYDLLGLTKEEAYGNLTFSPAIKDSVKYDYDTKTLTSYWTTPGYKHTRENGNRFFSQDEYKVEWSNPATFLEVTVDGEIKPRFMETYKNVDYMFLGDSYLNPSYWGTYKEDTQDIFALNFGFSGSYALDWYERGWVDTVGALIPKNIVIHMGVNDFNVGLKDKDYATRVSETANRVKTLINQIHTKTPNSKLYWITMEPNELHKTEYQYYNQVNNQIIEYASNLDYLTVINTYDVMFVDGNVSASLYLADKLHMSSFGYARWVNTVKAGLGLPTNFSTTYGNSTNSWSTCGWSETTINGETVLTQSGTSTVLTDKYIFFKDTYASKFSAKASFNVSKIYNGDAWPKFGFIIDDGLNQVLIFIGTDKTMKSKSVGYVTRTPSFDGKGALLDWNSGKETQINCYFTGEDWAELEIVKDGSSLKVIINGFELYDVTLNVCTKEVSVGFFTFNTNLNVKSASVEVK